tara:strand:- start:4677 stop:5081 length:405 start_codon:yes stop_codon:yes gene_type:complete
MDKFSNELNTELVFKTSRSGGKGGQNVNKTETKVQLLFSIADSAVLQDHEKERIQLKLANRINQEGVLIITSSDSRSQLGNKETAIKLFYQLVNKALQVQKKRRPTKPTKASVKRRIEAKKRNAEKKRNRKNDF